MNYTDDPISNLAECIAHAQYVGFSDIQYETRDWQTWRDTNGKEDRRIPAVRRPTTRDFIVYAMFPQVWGSTALGHGGMGGASITTAYTVVLECSATEEYLVYFGGTLCYKVNRRSINLATFFDDCKEHNLASKKESGKYQ